jgi:hypothetical protein
VRDLEQPKTDEHGKTNTMRPLLTYSRHISVLPGGILMQMMQKRKVTDIVTTGLSLAAKKAAEKTGEIFGEKSVDNIAPDPDEVDREKKLESISETNSTDDPKSLRENLLEAADLLAYASRQLERVVKRM